MDIKARTTVAALCPGEVLLSQAHFDIKMRLQQQQERVQYRMVLNIKICLVGDYHLTCMGILLKAMS